MLQPLTPAHARRLTQMQVVPDIIRDNENSVKSIVAWMDGYRLELRVVVIQNSRLERIVDYDRVGIGTIEAEHGYQNLPYELRYVGQDLLGEIPKDAVQVYLKREITYRRKRRRARTK